MVDQLRRLINFKSYPGKEKPILEYIRTQLERNDIQPFFQKDNLIVKLAGKDQSRAFIFNGHVDIVDASDISKWKHNPWAGEVVNGRIYGRGVSDMKGGILAMMETAKSLKRKDKIPTDVFFAFVVKEETDGQGTKQFAAWLKSAGYTKKYRELTAVFAEPTSLDMIQYGHRGNFFIRAEMAGFSGHSSRPYDINPHAIIQMSKFIGDLERENLRWRRKFIESEFTPPTITPTSIKAKSESPNKTAVSCLAVFDLRTIPGYHNEAFKRVEELAKRRGIRLSLIHPPSPIGYTKPNAKIVKIFQGIIPGIKTTVNDASNDLGFFTNIGIDGVIFGPGEISQAHRTDESADIKQVTAAPEIFEKVYMSWAQDAKH